MDALLPAFIAVLLAETGGRAQSLAAMQGSAAFLAALALSSLISLAIGAAGAVWIGGLIGERPRMLLAGLALLFAGVPMLFPSKPPKPIANTRFATVFFAFLARQLGDASQFIVFALAARGNSVALSLLGGFSGVMAAGALPMIVGRDWPGAAKLLWLRRLAALLLALTGGWFAISALGIAGD